MFIKFPNFIEMLYNQVKVYILYAKYTLCKFYCQANWMELLSKKYLYWNAETYSCYFIQMPKLQEKLAQELKNDGVVIACRFPFPNEWTPTDSIDEGIDTVWLYKKQQYGQCADSGQPRETSGEEKRWY